MPHSTTKRIAVALVLIILLGAGAGGYYYQHHRVNATQSDELTLYGNIDLREVQMAFNESARITRMTVQAGDAVHRGQLLATLEARRYRASLQHAQAGVDASQAALERLLAGSRQQDIKRLQALVQADQAELESKQLTFDRLNRLVRQKAATQQSLDEARAAMQAAAGHLEADRQSLKLAIAGPRAQDIAEARANLAGAKATLKLARQALEDTRLYAPSSGVIRNRILEPGDMASPSQPLYTLALTNPLWARVYVDEKDLGRIRPGLPATVSSDSFPGKRFNGWVGYISPTAEFTPKPVETTRVRSELVYQVRVYICNAAGDLRLGMPVTVNIRTDAAPVKRGETPCQRPQP